MIYKKYYLNIIFRVSLLLINCIAISATIIYTNYIYVTIFFGILIILQTILLINYLNQTNFFLEQFLSFINESNTSINFSNTFREFPFRELSGYFEKINQIIRDAKIEKENHYQFLQYIINHVNTGLIAFNENNHIKLINKAAEKLLNIKNVNQLHSLNKYHKTLLEEILSMVPGQQKIIPIQLDDKNLQLSVKLSKFKLLDEYISLLSLQDIKPELDHKEIESWQKLNRVLTHEIMNSVSPIIGLTKNIGNLLKKNNKAKKVSEINDEILEQTIQSINIVEDRSLGLKNFIQNFKNITTKIKPVPKVFLIEELFEDISILMHELFQKNNIHFKHTVNQEKLEMFADKGLIQQVLINILKNAIEALDNQSKKEILLQARQDENNKIIIDVIDNGKGINPENIDLIFTPFFSTKESGSGIGLSLSRNILKQQNMDISVFSIPGEMTRFSIYS